MSSSATKSRSQPHAAGSEAAPTFFTDQQNLDLLQGLVGMLAVVIVLRALSQMLSLLAFPLVFVYATMTCPSMDSFDAKKELKRVLRGADLAENDPNKPRGFLGKTLAKVTATVTAELATGLGYEETLTPFAGAATLATLRVPAANMDLYWIGAFGKWRYLYQQEIPKNKAD